MELVARYPSVSFHQDTQRLAVGTVSDRLIIIFDLRTATKWRIFSGHTGAVAAVTFSPAGEHLVSYSAEEAAARVWQVGASGLLSGLLGLQGRCLGTTSLRPLQRAVDYRLWVQNIRMTWRSSSEVELVRENGEAVIISV